MRTSHFQYVKMVDFMEANGDLSKSGGARGRHFIQIKWKELVKILNNDKTGESKSEEKWRKVWSDLKNNCKRKAAKIKKAKMGLDGGKPYHLALTDLENRVMDLMGMQAATSNTEEIEVIQNELPETFKTSREGSYENSMETSEIGTYCNTPGTSSKPFIGHMPAPTSREQSPAPSDDSIEEKYGPSPSKKKRDLIKLFMDNDKLAKEYARERDRAYVELERERLRVRELEVQERVRQRDVELRLQADWLKLMKELTAVFVKYIEKKS